MNTLKHITLEPKVYSLKGWMFLVDPSILFEFFQSQLENADFTILDVVQSHFPGGGYTATWILAESHLAIHTFKESGWTYIELTSCNADKAKSFKNNILKSDFEIKLDSDSLQKSSV